MRDDVMGALESAMTFVRQNISAHLVGLNPMTFAKHTGTAMVNSITEVGVANYLKAQATMFAREGGETRWNFAIRNGEELQRRHKNYVDNVQGRFSQTYGALASGHSFEDFAANFSGRSLKEGVQLTLGDLKGKYLNLRQALMYIESAPLAYGDLFSAVPTWLAQYDKSVLGGADHGEAVFEADRAVRRAHGSTAITNRPSILRQSPFVQNFTMFYGFFNHILQRQYELAWASREALKGEKGGYYIGAGNVIELQKDPVTGEFDYKNNSSYKTGAAAIPVLAGMLVSYAIFPAMWEEFLQPSPDADKESQPWRYAKAAVRGLSSSWIGIRDMVHSVIEGGDITAGMLGHGSREGLRFVQDLQKTFHRGQPMHFASRAEQENFIRHSNSVFSTLTGLSDNSVARMGIFGYNSYTGHDHPQNLREFWRGLTTGQSRPRKVH
jgi:hypothetical protein